MYQNNGLPNNSTFTTDFISTPMVFKNTADENKIREIIIKEVARGYIIEIGCLKFAIGTKAELIAKLSAYIKKPLAIEKKWFDGKLF